jgi:hypothetical protein
MPRLVNCDSAVDGSVAGVQGAVDYAISLSRDASRGISTIKPDDLFGQFSPDRDGYMRTGFCRRAVASRRVPGTASPRRGRRAPSTTVPNFCRRPSPRCDAGLSQPPRHARRIVDYRGESPRWVMSVQSPARRLLSG